MISRHVVAVSKLDSCLRRLKSKILLMKGQGMTEAKRRRTLLYAVRRRRRSLQVFHQPEGRSEKAALLLQKACLYTQYTLRFFHGRISFFTSAEPCF